MPEPEEEWAKHEVANGGDHPWVDTRHDDKEIHDKAYLAKTVYEVEINAIKNRRQYITTRNRHSCEYTGLALSGGGIRSASFGLGTLHRAR